MTSDLKMDGAEIAEILEYLNRWAAGTENDAPFLVMMGRTMTPDEFVSEVERGTPFGSAFLTFIDEQARRCRTRPLHLVYQAIVADRVR
jgi:hypothetical protein